MATVLHLGNVSFVDREGKAVISSETMSRVQIVSAVSVVIELFFRSIMLNSSIRLHLFLFFQLVDCDYDQLVRALTHRTIEANREKMCSPLNHDQAVYARDALAKAIYGRMFNWLVQMINGSLDLKVTSLKSGVIYHTSNRICYLFFM